LKKKITTNIIIFIIFWQKWTSHYINWFKSSTRKELEKKTQHRRNIYKWLTSIFTILLYWWTKLIPSKFKICRILYFHSYQTTGMEDLNSIKTVNNLHNMPKVWKNNPKNRGKPLWYLSSISLHEALSAEVDAKLWLTEKPHPKFEHVKGATSHPELEPSTVTSEMPGEMPVEDGTPQTFSLVKSEWGGQVASSETWWMKPGTLVRNWPDT